MKTLIVILLCPAVMAANVLAGAGSGPWADGAYYPGGLDGKYMGIVTGNNISGVLGFGIKDGAPPFRVQNQETSSGGFEPIPIVNQQIGPDILQNYFAIFVEGRTYTGTTFAGIDIDKKEVAGALQGQNPVGLLPAGDNGDINFDATDALSIINRGLSGGFTAKVKKKKAVFTFKGNGQLSTPANRQSYQIETDLIPFPDSRTNQIVSGVYQTHSTAFQLSGIRTSFFSSNPAAQSDQLSAQGGGGN